MITDATAQKVTDRIIAHLESGTIPWRKTWRTLRSYNIVSGKPYRGSNALFTHPMITGFKSPVFMTFRQCEKLGGKIVKGSKAITVTRPVTYECKETGNKRPTCMRYSVFNFEQTEGINLEEEDKFSAEKQEIPKADEVFLAMNPQPVIEYGPYDPCYSKSTDKIYMPPVDDFESSQAFHETRWHEVAHWTGHESRLDRDLTALILDKHSYSKEELVAELTSAFCCSYTGIDTELENQAAYCASWLKALGDDRRFLIDAAKKADEAFRYIIGEKTDDNNR